MKTKLEQATELATGIMDAMKKCPNTDPLYILRDNLLHVMKDLKKDTHELTVTMMNPDDEDIIKLAVDNNVDGELLTVDEDLTNNQYFSKGKVRFTGTKENLSFFTIKAFRCHEMLTHIKEIK